MKLLFVCLGAVALSLVAVVALASSDPATSWMFAPAFVFSTAIALLVDRSYARATANERAASLS